MMSAFDTTAVDAIATFPVVPVVNNPSGIIVIWHIVPATTQNAGAVIVSISVVPLTWKNRAVGAIVVADATTLW